MGVEDQRDFIVTDVTFFGLAQRAGSVRRPSIVAYMRFTGADRHQTGFQQE